VRVKGKRKAQRAGNDPERQRNASRSAMNVFSVDTVDEAIAAQIRFCVHRYDGSYAWTDWPRDMDPQDGQRAVREMDAVSDELREWWEEKHA
jgi:hypothetical protein